MKWFAGAHRNVKADHFSSQVAPGFDVKIPVAVRQLELNFDGLTLNQPLADQCDFAETLHEEQRRRQQHTRAYDYMSRTTRNRDAKLGDVRV